MSQLNDKIYFSNAEMVEILKHYSDEHRKGKVEKIDYKVWRKLKCSEYGIIVELQGLKRKLAFCESPISHLTRNPAPCALGDFIAEFDVFDSNFGLFFYDNYYRNHSDYCQIKEEENMATTISSNMYDYANNQTVWSNVTDYHTNYDYWNTIGTVGTIATQEYVDKSISEALCECNKEFVKEKENKNMKGFNFDFGPCTNNNIRMSMYGIAVKNMNDEWVSYNPQTAQIINVDIFNFDGRKYMFKMPVALKDVAVGDVIVHQKKAMFVIAVEDKGLVVVDVMDGEEKKVIPTTNLFGFDFITKIVSMFDFNNMNNSVPTAENPFGNMWMFALMSDNKDFNIKDMIVLSMMSSNNNANLMNNPMMLMMLMNEKNDASDLFLPMMLMNQNNTNKKK